MKRRLLNYVSAARFFVAIFVLLPLFEEGPSRYFDASATRPLPLEDRIAKSEHRLDEIGASYLLLPDLQTLPPHEARLVVDPAAGRKFIRFSNTILNSGTGPLELKGVFQRETNTIEVTQVLYTNDQRTIERRVGQFVFHAEHDHWHWDNFSVYEIWSLSPDESLDSLVASSGKVGYCLRDTDRLTEEQTEKYPVRSDSVSTTPSYTGCGWTKQGLLPGWSDVYRVNTPGQFVDISHLDSGTYALKSTANPDGILLETDVTNNSAYLSFSLDDARIQILENVSPAESHEKISPPESPKPDLIFGLDPKSFE